MVAAGKGVHACLAFISFAVLLMSFAALSKAKSDSNNFSMDVQGSIFCLSSGNKATPIQGATAEIVCRASNGGGDMSIISNPTNANGFYTAKSSTSSKLGNCKAFLHSSPLPACSSPTNDNGGKSGAALLPFSSSGHSRNQHYSVKPFFYSPN